MALAKDIQAFNSAQGTQEKMIVKELAALISETLKSAEGKVWHGAPVWFIDGNPVVGYSVKKAGVELLFWSGQSFDEELLLPTGKYKAAGIIFNNTSEIKKTLITKVLRKSKSIQWDYANLPKNKKLVKKTSF